MRRKLFSAIAILALVVAAAAWGCGGGGITGQELIDGVLENAGEQETARCEMSIVSNMSGVVEGEYGELDISMEAEAVFDMADEEMELDLTTVMNIRTETKMEETTTLKEYIIGDTAYVGLVKPVSPTEWVKGDVPGDFWERENYVSQQVELLRGAEVEILGTEKVKGISCYVVNITPDMDKIMDIMSSRLKRDMFMELTEDSISNYSMKGWYAKGTFFGMKAHQEFDFTFDFGGDNLTAHYVVDILLYDHNEPVSIHLPPEAQEAEYVGAVDV